MTGKHLNSGIIYLVGAGPGHPGLITKLGYDLLNSCDAVVYDDLIPIELVVSLPENIERFYVGKRSGHHSKPQVETNDLLCELAEQGMKIFRLKGGDPMVFGRVAEEAAFLKEKGILHEIIPGITSASAAAADAGFSLTDRRSSSWVMLTTGREAMSASAPVPWEDIGKLEGGTIAIYMGVKQIKRIVESLLQGGMSPNKPVAVVQNASTGNQQIVRASLSGIVQKCMESNVVAPALIFIGDVTGKEEFSLPPKDKPLTGKSVLVTRPAEQTASICKLLRDKGATPIPYPTIALSHVSDDDGWRRFGEIIEVGGWCVFTSEAGVRHFFMELPTRGFDNRVLGKFKIAAVGQGTFTALRERGFVADLVPERALVRDLAETLVRKENLRETCVIRIRGNLADESVEKLPSQAGAEVIPLNVYRNSNAVWEQNWIEKISILPPEYLSFTSGSTVDRFIEILGIDLAKEIASKSRVATIGPSTTAIAVKSGLKVTVKAKEFNVSGLVDAICEDARSNL